MQLLAVAYMTYIAYLSFEARLIVCLDVS
jgi:hypothetical protein